MVNFNNILEEALKRNSNLSINTSNLDSSSVKRRFLAGIIMARIKKELPPDKKSKRYLTKNLWSVLNTQLTPDLIENYKQFFSKEKDYNEFLRYIDNSLSTSYGVNLPSNFTKMVISKFSVDDYTIDSDDEGYPHLRNISTRFKKKVNEQTEFQKYTNSHKLQDSHGQSRISGVGDENRKSLKMGSSVRNDKMNPYECDILNRAEKSPQILINNSPDMKCIVSKYGIDFSDRREKTIKGKTGIYLIPLNNGNWKITHK